MSRLLIHVEGETEETFVNELLAGHLYDCGYTNVSARLLGNARQRERRGGIRAWEAVRKDILNHLRDDQECLASTMVDYYGLPRTGSRAWPGRAAAGEQPFAQKANTVEQALLADINERLCGDFDSSRFIPYVMMHEFEGMLFSDCDRFSSGIGRTDLTADFQAIRDAFDNPEEINDSPNSAPSKRIKMLMPDYEKPLLGTLAAIEIGLRTIREECPHFAGWLKTLEERPD